MPEKMSESTLVTLANDEWDAGMGHEGGEISQDRAKAMDFYLQKPYGDEEDGMSQVVTSEVADVVDGIMPSLMRLFMAGDNLADFDAFGEEDEEAAAQETDAVHYAFFKQNPAFILLFFWFFDALLQKNGYVMAWWDDSEEIALESYEGLSATELALLNEEEDLEPLEVEPRVMKTVGPVETPAGPQQGVVDDTVYDAKFRRVRKYGCPKIDNVPPEEMRVSADARTLGLAGCRMVGREREVTRGELYAMDFDRKLVDSLPALGEKATQNTEGTARRDKSDERNDEGASRADSSQDRIRLRWMFQRVDFDGDGRAELREIFIGGEATLLQQEEVDRQPFHALSPQPLPHKHFGRATAEKVMDLQRINSVLVRQIHDNLYHTNNPGHAVWEQAIGENTLDDLLTTRAGALRRFSRPPAEAYQAMTVPFTAGASFPMLEYWDKVKRDRTGIGSDSEGLSPEALKHIQQSVLASSVDISKLKVELIARLFAETGIKSLFLHLHELLQKHQQKAEVLKLRGKYVPVDPRGWKHRRDMTAKIGLGLGSREQNLIHLEAIWQKLVVLAQSDRYAAMVTPENVFAVVGEFIRNAGFKNPERFVTLAPAGGGDQAGQKALAAQLDLARQQIAVEQQKNQLQLAKLQLERQKTLAELRLKAKDIDGKQVVALEELANALTEMELKYGADVPGSKV